MRESFKKKIIEVCDKKIAAKGDHFEKVVKIKGMVE